MLPKFKSEIANQRGIIDAAAVGIVEKFIGLVFIVPSAMLSTVSAISAQNIGAGNLFQRFLHSLWLFFHLLRTQQHLDSLRSHSAGMALVRPIPRHALSYGIEYLYWFCAVVLDMRGGILVDEEDNE